MKMRELTRRAGSEAIFAWPPRWAGSFDPGDAWDTVPRPGEGVLESTMLLEASTVLRLTMRFEGREYTGLLSWDPPPSLTTVEHLLNANLGRGIRAIGELDVTM
jgi:hypothetical protein